MAGSAVKFAEGGLIGGLETRAMPVKRTCLSGLCTLIGWWRASFQRRQPCLDRIPSFFFVPLQDRSRYL